MSLLQALQKVAQNKPEESGVFEAVVVAESPLSIQLVDNPKIQPSAESIVVPERLTSKTYDVTIYEIDKLTLDDSLKAGDRVFGVFSDFGQRYYIIDRVG